MADLHYDGINKLRAWVFDEDQMVDIYSYYFNGLHDHEFKSTYKGRNYCVDDALYFIIPRETFKDMINNTYEQGYEDGKRNKKKVKVEEKSTEIKPIEEIIE